jgi:hypothetical protein
MFWTAFIWGLGVTLGGSMGLMAFILLYDLWVKLGRSKTMKRANELAELANAALTRRNELTEIQIEHLATIASSLEDLELSNRK